MPVLEPLLGGYFIGGCTTLTFMHAEVIWFCAEDFPDLSESINGHACLRYSCGLGTTTSVKEI